MSSTATALEPIPPQKPSHAPRPKVLDVLLFVVVTLAVAFVFGLLCYSLFVQIHAYSRAIERAMSDPERGDVVVLAYTRATDFAIVKTSVVFLGFILAFFGALYVLRTAGTSFTLSGHAAGSAASLRTTSPGLVMVVLGVVTVNLALFKNTSVAIDQSTGGSKISIVPAKEQVAKPVDWPQMPQSDDILLPPFPSGSGDLTSAQKNVLTRLGQRLADDPSLRITIQEQLDNNESSEVDLALSDRRQDAIAAFLRGSGSGNRVSVISVGKEPPLGFRKPPSTKVLTNGKK